MLNTLQTPIPHSRPPMGPQVRNARYLAELSKFKLYPPGSFFVALKQLLDDFQHHNVDSACAMVETAGRCGGR
jgi:regulator of nonsense transcripts 2